MLTPPLIIHERTPFTIQTPMTLSPPLTTNRYPIAQSHQYPDPELSQIPPQLPHFAPSPITNHVTDQFDLLRVQNRHVRNFPETSTENRSAPKLFSSLHSSKMLLAWLCRKLNENTEDNDYFGVEPNTIGTHFLSRRCR